MNSQVQDSALLRGSFGTTLNNEIDTLALCPISQKLAIKTLPPVKISTSPLVFEQSKFMLDAEIVI